MSILISLAVGILLIVLAFLGLNRLVRLGGRQSAVILAILTLGFYLPFALLNWPGADVLAIHLALYLMVVFILGVWAHEREQQQRDKDRSSLRWGPGLIIGFFAVIIAMDAVFVTVAMGGLDSRVSAWLLPKPKQGEAISSYFPGVISHDYQKKEALYNDYLRRVELQKERGWQVEYGWLEEPIKGREALFQVLARDRHGSPVSGAEVSARFLRPSNQREDFHVTLREVEPGLYRAAITPHLAGLWQVVILVQRGEDIHEVRAATDVAAP
ncbi:MAG: FixH family protein [Gammaproteobacteria bacterium]|nr:FixH family protein [Gammaproteobacteria bacterium]